MTRLFLSLLPVVLLSNISLTDSPSCLPPQPLYLARGLCDRECPQELLLNNLSQAPRLGIVSDVCRFGFK